MDTNYHTIASGTVAMGYTVNQLLAMSLGHQGIHVGLPGFLTVMSSSWLRLWVLGYTCGTLQYHTVISAPGWIF